MRNRTADQRRALTERRVRHRLFILHRIWNASSLDVKVDITPGRLRKFGLNCGCLMCRVRFDRRSSERQGRDYADLAWRVDA